MNWTGGRLRRQSRNRLDTISKIQEQHFARARIKQQESRQSARIASIEKPSFVFSGRGSAGPSQSIINNQSTPSNARIDPLSQCLKSEQSQAYLPDVGGFLGTGKRNLETKSNIAYVDLLKKHLLDKKDWVGLSPTRPLQMKFTPTEEKERIGKRRRLSREDDARKTAIIKHFTSFARISSHAGRPQSGGGLHNGKDWNFKIHISSPKRVRRTQEYSESPIRSKSSDTMLSGFGEAGEGYVLPEQNEQSCHSPSNMEDESLSETFIRGPDGQTYSTQEFDNSEQKVSADAPKTDHIWSSSIPVLHRFTLDDQVLAGKRLANSQMEAKSPRNCQSDQHSTMLIHGMLQHHDTYVNEILLDSSLRIHSDDRHTDLSGSHKSCPTDSATLPQTQKISRQLPPSQSQMARTQFSEAQFGPPRVTSRISTRPESVVKIKEPVMLFGQAVHSLSPEAFDKEASTSERTFQSKMHGYHLASPHVQLVSTPRAVNQTSALKPVSKASRPTSGFRFPRLWTPHRAIPHLSSFDVTGQKDDLSTSPIVSHRRPSPFISTLPQGNNRSRQPRFSARSLSKIPEDTKFIGGHEGTHAPVFNTPFRR